MEYTICAEKKKEADDMKRRIGIPLILAAVLAVAVTVAVLREKTAASASASVPDGKIEFTGSAAWANYTDYFDHSKDAVMSGGGKTAPLPVFRCDTREDYEALKLRLSNWLSFENARDDCPSMDELAAGSGLGNGKTLIIAYVTASSGSLRFGVKDVYKENGKVTMEIIQLNDPEVFTCDMAGWWLVAEVDTAALEGCDVIEAVRVKKTAAVSK